jgi:5'-nucleotidase/UDP-sugar diphosphatase
MTETTVISRRKAFAAFAATGAAVAAGQTPAGAQGAGGATVTLLLVNDIYKMSEERGRGGFSRLAAIVKAERAKGVPLVYAHAGDCFSPSIMSGFNQGAHIVELLNVAPPDIFVPGNHEFDFGKDNYLRRRAESRFPYFAANMRGPGGAALEGHVDRRIVEAGPVKIGIFGVALQITPSVSSPGDLAFSDEMRAVEEQARALRGEGADIIVAVTHTAFLADLAIFRSRLVDILLTGHDHDLRLVYDGRVAMVESGEEGHYVTAVDVTCSVGTQEGRRVVQWRPNFRVIDSASVTPDPEAAAILARHEADLSRELDVEIGVAQVETDSRSATVRSQEAVIGNIICDAMRQATGADVAVTNGGGIRGNKVYPPGTRLTRRDVLTELPFGNTINVVEITGADLLAALENGVSQVEARQGRFPHVSGMTFVVDRAAPAGSRVSAVRVGDRPLDATARYRVATNNFMAAGGDGYGAFARGRTLVGGTDGRILAGEVMGYIRRLGTVRDGVEGRIVIR